MSVSQVEVEGGSFAASRIAADPAFSALDASGAPIVAACGDPLEIIHLNDSARAVFGADADAVAKRLFFSDAPGAKRLVELVESVRHGAALRLERLHFDLADAPQTITILCRKLAEGDARACFVIAALGVRPATAKATRERSEPDATTETAAIAQAAKSVDAPPPVARQDQAATREMLVARHGPRARFLWKTDAAGRFTDVTQTLADVVGVENADILGRAVEEIAADFSLGPALATAIATRKSWGGVDVNWPLDGCSAHAPATLGALPIMDADRRFAGFQGYGVLHLTRAFVSEPPMEKEESPAAPPEPLPPPALEAYPAANVVPLRPVAPRQEPEHRVSPVSEKDALTSSERMNFEEIARALRAGDLPLMNSGEEASAEGTEAMDAPSADSGLDAIAAELQRIEKSASEPAPAQPSVDQAPALPAADVLDCLPVGVLIARGAQTLFANRTLLDYLGYKDAAAFEADGGLARMFFGRPPANPGARAAAVQSSEGETLDVDVHLQSVEWDGAPATLVTLRRNRNRLPGPEESALGLAREREEKLARLQTDNSQLRAILEASGVAVAVLGDDARIENATGGFATHFNTENRALEGLPLASLFALEETRALAARLIRATETGETLRLTARVGAKSFEASCRRLGPARKLCFTLREPSSQIRNIELEAARDAAEQASAAKSDFLARVSHEIRTPLNAIIGFAEVMMEERFGPIGSVRYKEYLKDVHASGAHVLSLVNDLLDLSKIEAGKMELEFDRVDANAVISECASIMQTQANQARVVMRLSLAPRLPPIRADRRSLKQILLNLLSNAMKFNEAGGQVIVSSALTDAGYVVIRVKDTGIGMSDDEVQIALEPFKQILTAPKRPGTGLGLPLTKALIEANNASFTIQSRKNEGTLIEVAFPPPQVLAAE
ncbi:HAMP domain-containing histidine kinase [Methylocystis sp. MJC1]|jgi:signal transduction histidine kinase|uniref:PAS domain-containing sensor histidine kinase n=1 Tax=Methylocystis sp. MJC1 TaxID=2654282 RepID=UPI0013ED651A|nr:HAMP domain-containing sensor histidine kinase [Methylocystis sp. MJC1]KAF2990798.1 Cell-division control histidine kinase PdhS [Methylocystis sp. MJC1]MBU6528604.1 HAMP domain-containing histidine kinase [Methylocystis sp. MJC1]UZX11497.1 HAMP domain-containing histidine kinase [Methylocystis sp. MJC1]